MVFRTILGPVWLAGPNRPLARRVYLGGHDGERHRAGEAARYRTERRWTPDALPPLQRRALWLRLQRTGRPGTRRGGGSRRVYERVATRGPIRPRARQLPDLALPAHPQPDHRHAA